MTNKEAIAELLVMKKFNYTLADAKVFDSAIEALIKQIPKKPEFLAYDGNAKIGNNHCPSCDCIVFQNLSTRKVDFCICCGQAIDWSDTE